MCCAFNAQAKSTDGNSESSLAVAHFCPPFGPLRYSIPDTNDITIHTRYILCRNHSLATWRVLQLHRFKKKHLLAQWCSQKYFSSLTVSNTPCTTWFQFLSIVGVVQRDFYSFCANSLVRRLSGPGKGESIPRPSFDPYSLPRLKITAQHEK